MGEILLLLVQDPSQFPYDHLPLVIQRGIAGIPGEADFEVLALHGTLDTLFRWIPSDLSIGHVLCPII